MRKRWAALALAAWAAACGDGGSHGAGLDALAGAGGGAGKGGSAGSGGAHGGAAGSSSNSGSNNGGSLGGDEAVAGNAPGGAGGAPVVDAPGGAENAGVGGQANEGLAGQAGSTEGGASFASAGAGSAGEGGASGEPPPCPKPPGELCHELVFTDDSNKTVSYVNEFTSSKPGAVAWNKTFSATPRSVELVDNASADGGKAVLVGMNNGFLELDLSDGGTLVDVAIGGLTTARSANRMVDGTTALALNDEIRIVSAAGVAVRNFGLPAGAGLGLVHRDPATGHFWFGKQVELYEISDQGQVLWNKALSAGSKAQAVWWRADGGAYATTGDAATVTELDGTGVVVDSLGGKVDFPELDFLSGFVQQPNGNFIVANWLGHLANPAANTPELVELTAQNELVWQWGTQTFARQILDVCVLR